MERVESCPVCEHGSSDFVTRRGKDFVGQSIVSCPRCEVFYQSPRLTESELAQYYRDEYSRRYRGDSIPDEAALRHRDGIARYRFDLLTRQDVLRGGDEWLEVGCGAGNFLHLCSQAEVNAWGVEPSEGYGNTAKEAGLAVEVGTFPEHHGERDQYHGAALFHVLEHLPRPLETLRRVRELLRPDGSLVVEVPELTHALGPRWSESYFHAPHLIDFTEGSLQHLLRRAGFEVMHRDYCTSSPRRSHHLLVVARPVEDAAVRTLTLSKPVETLRNVRRWIRISRWTAPIYRGTRAVVRTLRAKRPASKKAPETY